MSRIFLKDLTPGTDYAIELRTNQGDSVSQWSRKFAISTTADVTPPDVPDWAASDEWVINGDTFVATWLPLDFNEDQNKDFDHYEITLDNGVTSATVRTTNTSYTLTFDQNRIFFGTPSATVTAKVRAVDQVGNASAYNSTESATNPAPGPASSISVTGLYDAVDINWVATPPDDFKEYLLQVSTTSSSTGFSNVYSGPSPSFTHATVMFVTDHWYRVFVRDKFGTLSTSLTSGAVQPKSTVTVDTTPPSNATSFVATPAYDAVRQASYIDLSWTSSVSTDVDGYNIRYSTNGTNWQYIRVPDDAVSARIENLLPGQSYYVAIQASDLSANLSGWLNATVYPVTTSADTTAPSTPNVPTASVGTQKLQVVVSGLKADGVTAMEGDVDYYEVFASTTTGFTTYNSTTMLGTIQKGPAIIETFNIPAANSSGTTETWYVKVRAVDRSGNVSAASAQATAAVGLILTANIGDLQVTTAKINSLEANKIVAGTGIINDLTVKSILTLGDVSTEGVIRSYDYVTSSGVSGFYMDKNELIIKSGQIEAAALKIQNGENLIHPAYADFRYDSAYYTSKISYFAGTGSIDTVDYKWNDSSFKWMPSSTFNIAYLGASDTDTSMILAPSTTYIVSYYAMIKTAATALTIQPQIRQIRNDTTFVNSSNGSHAIPANSTWARYSTTITTNVNAAGPALLYFFNTVAGTVYIDGIQIEQQVGALTTPSPWTPSSQTLIDGYGIRTGAIESNQLAVDAEGNTISGVKKWSINTQGNANFGDMLIRGRVIMGLAGSEPEVDPATGEETSLVGVSQLQSYNYNPGQTGWAVRSNGVAEFLQLKAQSIRGDVISTGSFTADMLGPGTIGADLFIGSQLKAIEHQTLVVTNKELVSNVAIITVSPNHERVIGDRIWVRLEPADSTFDTDGNTFDVVTAVTDSTISYARTASNVSSTAAAGEIYVEGRSAVMNPGGIKLFNNDGVSVVVSLPTNPAEDAYYAGNIAATSLVVKNNFLLQGVDNAIAAGGSFTLAASTVAPSVAPVVTQTWNSVKTWLNNTNSAHKTGLLYDSVNSVWITANHFYGAQIQSFSADGSLVANFGSITDGAPYGITNVGGFNYVLFNEYDTGNWKVRKFTSAGTGWATTAQTWTYDVRTNVNYDVTASEWKINGYLGSALKDPAIGTDGTFIYIARCNKAGKIVVTRYNDDGTGAVVTATNITDNQNLRSINVGSFDFGASRWVITTQGTTTKTARHYITNTSGTHQTGELFLSPHNFKLVGAAWDGTRFTSLGENYYHYEHTGIAKSGSTTWSVKSTWHDLDISTVAVSNKVANGTTATLTVPTSHGFVEGDVAVVAGVDATFNGTHTLTSVTSTTVSYALAATVGSTAASGTVGTNEYETSMSPGVAFTITRRAKLNFAVASNIPDTGRRNDPDRARFYASNTGISGSHYRQADLAAGGISQAFTADPTFSGTTTTTTVFPAGTAAKFISSNGKLEISADGNALFGSTSDVNTSAGNKPPLRIGDPAGLHIRADGNEIQAMADDDTAGALTLNAGGGNIGMNGASAVSFGGSTVTAWNWGNTTCTANASGEDTVTHGLGGTPAIVVATVGSTGSSTLRISVLSYASTTFTVGARNSSTNATAVNGTNFTVRWIAIR